MDNLELFDVSPNVFVIIAHDEDMRGILPFFPKTLNGWEATDNKAVSRWRFLKDFEKAVKTQ